jgi:mycobactin lysine-N-oxygenase
MKRRERLLVIGAGPKALALAAKNEVLAALGLPVPEIQIIERHVVGAHWVGRHGYTNGKGLLGTPPDKDIGFPYQSDRWSERLNRLVDERMLSYSWTRFLVASGQFSDWIDGGRRHRTNSGRVTSSGWRPRSAPTRASTSARSPRPPSAAAVGASSTVIRRGERSRPSAMGSS